MKEADDMSISPEGQWRSRERERLISAVDRAAGDDTGKEETV
jgi:hypothetical protein